MTEPTTGDSGLGKVRDHMKVVDSNGDDVGKVESIHMGDPEAVTAQGQDVAAGLDDDVPPGTEERLARMGYVKIDAKGWFTGKRFATSDHVGEVTDDVVHLTVSKERLLH